MGDDVQYLSLDELMDLVRRAQDAKAPVSLRGHGSNRLLGDLHLRGMEAGRALHLMGAKRRDHLPQPGSAVTASLIIGDEVVSFEALVLEPIVASEGDTLFPPILRIGWPADGARFQNRRDVRVASPLNRALDATVCLPSGTRVPALILNLTETGMGLAMDGEFRETLPMRARVEATLPGGGDLGCEGEIRSLTVVTGEIHPIRLGLVMLGPPTEALKRFLQNRRTDLSQDLKRGGR